MTDSKFPPEKDDNTIDLTQARQAKEERAKEEGKAARRREGPLINLPPVTKWILFAIIGIFALQEMLFGEGTKAMLFYTFAFLPFSYFDFSNHIFSTLIGPITYMFLHANLFHILMNSVMLGVFGSTVERWLGTKRYLTMFIGCGLVAVFCHFFYAWVFGDLNNPVVGASGAISGLFAAALVLLQSKERGSGPGNTVSGRLLVFGSGFQYSLVLVVAARLVAP